MNRKPSRAFLYLAFVMIFMLVVGLIVIGVLISNKSDRFAGDLTAHSGCECNLTTVFNALQTETAISAQTPTP